ncbi:MAG: ABC transporter permease [Myxococcales bacterium]|nr:ABC transporter permease [Myxococcales bacterium]
MRQLWARLISLTRSALRGLSSSPVASGVAVVTIAISLVLVGAFALLASNMRSLLDDFGDALVVAAYLGENVPASEYPALADLARSVEGVESVQVISPEQALERFRVGVGRGAALLEGLSENPLPASLEITLLPEHQSAAGLGVVVESLEGLPGIDDLGSGQQWVEGYLRALALVRGLGIGLGAILGFAALLIVSNTIRLAMLSRRDELELLALVGASRSFVGAPLLLEGALCGAAGSALALALLFLLFQLVVPGFEFGLELLLGGLSPHFFAPSECLALMAAGVAVGVVGSLFALASERFA